MITMVIIIMITMVIIIMTTMVIIVAIPNKSSQLDCEIFFLKYEIERGLGAV